MEINERVKEIVQKISKKFYKIFPNTASLIWFGSWVRGSAYKQSDIDLAMKNMITLDDKKLLKFKQYISSFPTLYKIDLVDMRYANEVLTKEINKYGKPL